MQRLKCKVWNCIYNICNIFDAYSLPEMIAYEKKPMNETNTGIITFFKK